MLKGLLALISVLPKIFSYVDMVIGAFNRWSDGKRRKKVNQRDRDRNDLTRQLKRETDEDKRRALLRKLNRLG